MTPRSGQRRVFSPMHLPTATTLTRRQFVAATAAAAFALPVAGLGADVPPVFQQRSYYLCFMRMPTFGLPVWKETLDDAAADGANTIILWMGGAFRSKKFPITWQWAKEHENVKADFTRELIAHAHRRGIKVLLEKPELKAVGKDGKPVAEFGIGCWGWNLCPAKAESQRFMREYAREMAFEFYPEADGLFIESSDYAICHCAECGPKFFDHEFAFVRDLSNEVWARKPDATVVVYPHYFSGAKLRFAFAEATASKQPFDPRWTLFFIRNELNANFNDVRHWAFSFALNEPAVRTEEVGAVNLNKLKSAGGDYADTHARYDYITVNHFADITDGAGTKGVTISNPDLAFARVGNSSVTNLDTVTPQLHLLAGGQVDGPSLGIPAQNGNTHFLQCFALRPQGRDDQTAAMKFALEHQNPFVTGTITSQDGGAYPETTHSLLTVSNPNVLLWALKPHDDGIEHGIVARIWNQANAPAATRLISSLPLQTAQHLTHIETLINAATVKDGALETTIGAQRMETFGLKPGRP